MREVNLKKIISYLPEISFLLVAIWWFIDNLKATPSHVNYFMIAIVVFILALMIWRIKTFAAILAGLLGIGSLYMLLAVFSEYGEFPKGDPEGLQLLIIGCICFLGLAGMSILLPRKYFLRGTE